MPLGVPTIRTAPRVRAALIGVLLAVLGSCRGPASETNVLPRGVVLPRASVIVLSFDALRADALGVYKGRSEVSPNLDRFARESWLFEHAYSVSSQTPLSFAAAFTGQYPSRGDFRSPYEHWRLPAGPTLAATFAAGGYATAAFLANPWLRHPAFGAGFGEYRVYGEADDEVVLRDATEWLREQDAAAPVFLWIHLLDPHSPYRAHAESAHLYAPGYTGAYEREGLGEGTTSLAQSDPRELARLRELYEGEVHRLDRRFGAWREQLAGLGRLDSTILVVTSDHGEEFMEHGALQHSRLYEEHLRIPLIVRVPDSAGARVATRVSNLDLLPSLAALTGLAAPPGIDGRLWWVGAAPDEPLAFLVESDVYFRGAALRKGDHKLIESCLAGTRELFDLRADPAEQVNRLRSDRALARALERELWDALGVSGCAKLRPLRAPPASQPQAPALSDREREQLEALGYLPGESSPVAK